jgi:hypothetical protein
MVSWTFRNFTKHKIMNKQPSSPTHYVVDLERYNAPRNAMIIKGVELIKTYNNRFFLAEELQDLKRKIQKELNTIVGKHPRCKPYTYGWASGVDSQHFTLDTPDDEWTLKIKPAYKSSVWSEE